MVKSLKFKIGDKIYKPKGYKFPGTVVSIFKTTGGDIRIVAEMAENGMLHIFNENQLEHLEDIVLNEIPECERVAKSMLTKTLMNNQMSIPEAKEKVIKVIDDLMLDSQMPTYLSDFWVNIKIEIEKI